VPPIAPLFMLPDLEFTVMPDDKLGLLFVVFFKDIDFQTN
jgi:hypothetical protein